MGGDDTASLQSPERETMGLIASALWFFLLGLRWGQKEYNAIVLSREDHKDDRDQQSASMPLSFTGSVYIFASQMSNISRSPYTHTPTYYTHTASLW